MHVPSTQPVAAGMRGLGSTHLRWARRVCCTGERRALLPAPDIYLSFVLQNMQGLIRAGQEAAIQGASACKFQVRGSPDLKTGGNLSIHKFQDTLTRFQSTCAEAMFFLKIREDGCDNIFLSKVMAAVFIFFLNRFSLPQ